MSDENDSKTWGDTFQKLPHTPLLEEWQNLQELPPVLSELAVLLESKLKTVSDKQDFYNVLRRFKRTRDEEIDQLEAKPFENRTQIEFHHTETAEAIARVCLRRLHEELKNEFGVPTFLNSFGQITPAGLALLGMGRFGSGEMGNYSDLDLVFVYSNVGETRGKKTITNGEFYSKLVQRFINALSLMTEAGRCYEVDMELRPSGRSGPLVVSYERFLDHQMNEVQSWERMAWLKNRTIDVLGEFAAPISKQIVKLTYDRPIPQNFFEDMRAIREQVILEKVKESENHIDIKLGLGGLMDVDFILLGVQIKSQPLFHDLRVRGTQSILQSLRSHTLMTTDEISSLESAWKLFRAIESHWGQIKHRSEKVLNTQDDDFKKLYERLGFDSAQTLQDKILTARKNITVIYRKIYGHT